MPGAPPPRLCQPKIYPNIAKYHLQAESLPVENHWIKVKEELTCIIFHLISEVYISCGINSSLIHLVNTNRALSKLLGYAVLTVYAWVFYEHPLLAEFEYDKITEQPLWCLKPLCTWQRALWSHYEHFKSLNIASEVLGNSAHYIGLPCPQPLPGPMLGLYMISFNSPLQQ